nr:DCC1-like thiol-disulfide oxidoreductase family protein [Pontibacillus sp. ALD_SL1]
MTACAIFCDSSVQFIIKRGPNRLFPFASLNSDIGKRLMDEHNVPGNADRSVFIEGGTCYFLQSAGALCVLQKFERIVSVCLCVDHQTEASKRFLVWRIRKT